MNTTLIAAAGLVPLQAPSPSPPLFDLLRTVDVAERPDGHWLSGGATEGTVPGPAFVHDGCSTGTDRQKMGAGDIATQQSRTFTVYLPGFCTAQSIGPDPGYWTDRLARVFEAYESSAVERVLCTGDGHTVLGQYLADDNMEVLAGGLPTGPVDALGLLEQAVRRHGGGVIHCAPRTFTAWKNANLVQATFGKIYTELGTPVVVGYGYVGVLPNAGPPATSKQEWAFASGPIEVIRATDIEIVPPDYGEALDRTMNDVLFLAERPYLLNWVGRQDENDDDHIQAGVRVDLSALADTFIIVGSGVAYTIETPAGVIDGINVTFTLATVPVPATDLLLWKNGLFMTQGTDYTLAGNTITFDAAQVPPVDSTLVAAVPS